MTQMTLAKAFETADQHRQAGNLAAAEAIYRQVLAIAPNQPDAIHMLGTLAIDAGKLDLALDLIDRSIRINPKQAGYYANRAHVLSLLGRNDDAITEFQRALSLDPQSAVANNNLGNLYRQLGQPGPAIACYVAAANSRPDSPEIWMNLAVVLCEAGDFKKAAEAWRRLIQLQPDNPDAINNLGNALQEMRQYDEAIALYQRALSLRPDYPEAQNNLGNAYLRSDRPGPAVDCFRQAVAQKPDYAEAHRGLGNALKGIDQLDEAIAAHERSLRLAPANAEALSDAGSALHAAGRHDEAASLFRRAIDLAPDFAEAHFNLGLSLLLRGQFEEGWKEHEWRWRVRRRLIDRPDLPMPQWSGQAIDGKRLLIYGEQGFGDAIQFSRYLPLVAARGAKITFICLKELSPLLGSVPGIDRLIVVADDGMPPLDADFHSSLMSLPMLLGTTLDNIPHDIPYLNADPARSAQFKERIGSDPRLRVGLAWAGNPGHVNDRRRSMHFDQLAPLARTANVRFVSLQFGPAAAQAVSRPAEMDLIDWTADLHDFAESAGLIDNLDLVITVDTAAAHLAGAMGKPIWLLLPHVPGWRWMLDRSDSPWYPTMKLFRQVTPGDWSAPVESAAEALLRLRRA